MPPKQWAPINLPLAALLMTISLLACSVEPFGFGSIGGGGGGGSCCVCGAPPAPPAPACPPPPVCAPPPVAQACVPCAPPAQTSQSCAPSCAPQSSSSQSCAPTCAPQPPTAQNCAPMCAPQPAPATSQSCAPSSCGPQPSSTSQQNCAPMCAPQPAPSQNCAPMMCVPQPAPSTSQSCVPVCAPQSAPAPQPVGPMMGGGGGSYATPPVAPSGGTYAQAPQPQPPIQVPPSPVSSYQPPPPAPPPSQPSSSGSSYPTYPAAEQPAGMSQGSYSTSSNAGTYRDPLFGKEKLGIIEPGNKPLIRTIPSTTRSVLLPDPTTAYEDKPPEIDDYEENRVGAETAYTTSTISSLPTIVGPAGNNSPNGGGNGARTHHSMLPKKKDDQLSDDYTDNSFMKKQLAQKVGVPQPNDADNTGDPKCSSETLRQIMQENIVSSPTISKQLIFSAGRLAFGQSIDVVCSKNKFSYTVVSSRIFCESTRKRITCFAFLQP